MTEHAIIKGAAALILWRTGMFDTKDIADALSLDEPIVCTILHAARERERGPDLHLVGAST